MTGPELRLLRESLGLSRAAMAARLGISGAGYFADTRRVERLEKRGLRPDARDDGLRAQAAALRDGLQDFP